MSENRRAVVVVHSQGAVRTSVSAALAAAGFEVTAAASWRQGDPGRQSLAPRCRAILVELAQSNDAELVRFAAALAPEAAVVRLVDCFGPDAEKQVVLAHRALPGGFVRCEAQFLSQELARVLAASPH